LDSQANTQESPSIRRSLPSAADVITEADVPHMYAVAAKYYGIGYRPTNTCIGHEIWLEYEDAIQEAVGRIWEKRHLFDKSRGTKSTFFYLTARRAYSLQIQKSEAEMRRPEGSEVRSLDAYLENPENPDVMYDHRVKDTSSNDKILKGPNHCSRGHEMTPENTMIRKARQGRKASKRCRQCQREHERRRREKNKEKKRGGNKKCPA
jgi:DNA-directed RNA polymerase specialized sigma24 family protein